MSKGHKAEVGPAWETAAATSAAAASPWLHAWSRAQVSCRGAPAHLELTVKTLHVSVAAVSGVGRVVQLRLADT